ncbi:MAG: hypothetical protein COZ06_11675 [Armatimonadetes bacterium CG_4_10_14_3_um_filter_66_18]|nr:MAG: hypothetical protein COS65_24395 [Armatimonadetes bacterium CG06_land_8_20_14_3_00_66_21]PIX48890.1 MAG: hypothetical protein COZ57_04605 [Armatimonadetes bacterium CG_4_8_14_3_um_filter_66_20]PIY49990.1 MAG: hypothetical protein COZ06_11675 [Armatimonadetes bacterium CG_4_10_14_3_um_filter_66_18]PIZ34879.1 MAG: hypothetical protein COY42_27735 [Armatimonadetes bacterium CG_4_10_14_0_8_um_filter_66_14]PJB67729.1 MAG: hypothetical protein CO096_15560 [Armatimonadetes bacterium CG_4_9_14_
MLRLRSPSTAAGQRGQALALYLVGAVAVLACIGVALDGSNVYLQRRGMQNASDSAALAGARTLAVTNITNAEVLAAVRQYAETGGADWANTEARYVSQQQELSPIKDYEQGSGPPVEAIGVRVRARKTVSVVFGFLLGHSKKTAGAEATALVGPARQATLDGTAFPVTLEDDIVQALHPGQRLQIWDDDRVTDDNGTAIPGHRGWLNFENLYSKTDPSSRVVVKSMSNDDLMDWVKGGRTPPVKIIAGAVGGTDGDFILGDAGTRTSAVNSANARLWQTVLVPIFDAIYTAEDMQNLGSPAPPGGFGQTYYHIVAFAKFRIVDVVTTGADKYIVGQLIAPEVVDSSANWGGALSDETLLAVSLVDTLPGG